MGNKKDYVGKTDLTYIFTLIKNTFAKKTDVPDPQIQSDFKQTDTSKADYIKNKPNMDLYAKLDAPAFTGKPTVPTPESSAADGQIANVKYVKELVGGVTGIKFVKVASFESLPQVGDPGTIYLVPKSTPGTKDIYTEYYWDTINKSYEILGDTSVDLSGYLKVDDVVELSTSEIQAIWDAVFPTT